MTEDADALEETLEPMAWGCSGIAFSWSEDWKNRIAPITSAMRGWSVDGRPAGIPALGTARVIQLILVPARFLVSAMFPPQAAA